MKKYKETFEIEGDVSLAPTTAGGGGRLARGDEGGLIEERTGRGRAW